MYYIFDFDLTLTMIPLSDWKAPIFRENKFLQKIKNDIKSHLESLGQIKEMDDSEEKNMAKTQQAIKELKEATQLSYISQCEANNNINLDTDIGQLCRKHNIQVDISNIKENTIDTFFGRDRYNRLIDMLEKLKEKHIKVHILSHNFSYIIWFILVSVGLHTYFESIVCIPTAVQKKVIIIKF